MIVDIMGLIPGDANFDGSVDGSDFNIWNQSKYTNGCYTDGDFNFDGAIDNSDFNIWNQNKFTSVNLVTPVLPAVVSAEIDGARTVPSKSVELIEATTIPALPAVPLAASADRMGGHAVDRASLIDRVFVEAADSMEDSIDLNW